jgi:hypothetical protein
LYGFSPPHFCKPWKAAVSLIGLAKPSYTAGTLCEMGAKILLKIFKEHIDIIVKK